MIIHVEYTTGTDVGDFTTKAKFDAKSGTVYDIKPSNSKQANEISDIYRTTIAFCFKGSEFVLYVDPQEDFVVNYENTEFYHFFAKTEIEKKLKSSLVAKYGDRTGKKIKI